MVDRRMRKLTYTFKTDTLFKMLFVEHQDLLKKLVAVLMGIPVESITQFAVQNPEMLPENLGAKFCRLDINMAVNGQRVDLEVQVCNEGDYIERVMFYWAKEFAAAIPSGGNYAALPRTMILSILDFSLFECSEYQSFFQPLEVTRHTLMSDKMGFRFFELPKLPTQVSGKDELQLWLSLFRAETEEELEKIKAMEVPEMEQAINAYYSITASDRFKEIERMREKARHDEAQALYHAEQKGMEKGRVEGRAEGRAEGAFQNMVTSIQNLVNNMGWSIEQAMAALNVPESDRPKYKELLKKQ